MLFFRGSSVHALDGHTDCPLESTFVFVRINILPLLPDETSLGQWNKDASVFTRGQTDTQTDTQIGKEANKKKHEQPQNWAGFSFLEDRPASS